MMKRTLLALSVGSILALGSAGAQALPMALDSGAAGTPPIEKVIGGDGCGPYAFRGRSGFCRPLRRGPPRYGYYGGGPRYYGPPPRRGYYDGPRRRYGPPRPGVYFGF